MGFMHHVAACNDHDASGFIPFAIENQPVGRVRPAFARLLQSWPEIFSTTGHAVALHCRGSGLQERSALVAGVLEQLIAQGALGQFHGERYAAVAEGGREPLLLIDRAMAPCFGIRAYGQHVNGFVRTGAGLKMWIGRRADDRRHAPGRLDNLAAGGLPYGLSLAENLAKECWEEAGIPAQLARQATPVGAVTYHMDTETGFKPDTLFCYDLELPEDFVPRCMDGEVQSFHLWPVEQVMELVKHGSAFKLNCNLVIIDFLIRHGYIGPEDEEYLTLLGALHPSMPPLLITSCYTA
jgi:8-oxo-dGTP pyrophosphatase MutT (NUDIX family)